MLWLQALIDILSSYAFGSAGSVTCVSIYYLNVHTIHRLRFQVQHQLAVVGICNPSCFPTLPLSTASLVLGGLPASHVSSVAAS